MSYISETLNNIGNMTINTSLTIGVIDLLDIFIVAYLIYKIIFWIKETRAWTLLKGILVIFIFYIFASVLKLNTITWILTNTISVGIIAIIVVFQPELRRALEQLGKGKMFELFAKDSDNNDEKATSKTIDEILKAADKMGSVKTGALILIEKDVPLGELERTGIPIDAVVTSQLLINIFEKDTPLHDGAVIIRNNRVAAATCFLPLTESNDISMELGTRHRAAIGASEVSDAYVIVVSEETGYISMAKDGVLYRNISTETLRGMLSSKSSKQSIKKKISLWKGRQSDEQN